MELKYSNYEDKKNILNKEIKILSTEKISGKNGDFTTANIELEGKELKISLGIALENQLLDFVRKGGKIPCYAKIIQPKNKRYYAFEYLTDEKPL